MIGKQTREISFSIRPGVILHNYIVLLVVSWIFQRQFFWRIYVMFLPLGGRWPDQLIKMIRPNKIQYRLISNVWEEAKYEYPLHRRLWNPVTTSFFRPSHRLFSPFCVPKVYLPPQQSVLAFIFFLQIFTLLMIGSLSALSLHQPATSLPTLYR